MTIAPNLVCYEGAVGESASKGADPRVTCTLVQRNWKEASLNKVRKETLIVEATLTASCITGFSGIPRFLSWETCRDSDVPRREPSDPIWRAYHPTQAGGFERGAESHLSHWRHRIRRVGD